MELDSADPRRSRSLPSSSSATRRPHSRRTPPSTSCRRDVPAPRSVGNGNADDDGALEKADACPASLVVVAVTVCGLAGSVRMGDGEKAGDGGLVPLTARDVEPL